MVWQLQPVHLALERLRQEDHSEFGSSLGYIVRTCLIKQASKQIEMRTETNTLVSAVAASSAFYAPLCLTSSAPAPAGCLQYLDAQN